MISIFTRIIVLLRPLLKVVAQRLIELNVVSLLKGCLELELLFIISEGGLFRCSLLLQVFDLLHHLDLGDDGVPELLVVH